MKRIKREKAETEAWASNGDFISHHLIPLKRLFCSVIGAGSTYEDFYAVWSAQGGTGRFNSVITFRLLPLYQTVAVIIVAKQVTVENCHALKYKEFYEQHNPPLYSKKS
jgi:hypothetical protein